MSDFEIYLEKLEKLQGFTVNDLKNATVHAHANFLVAMGLFNYMEILGSFFYHKDANGVSTKRFHYTMDELMPPTYKRFSTEINNITGTTSYDVLRCGMSHEYLIKTYKIKGQPKIEVNFKIISVQNMGDFNYSIMKQPTGIELFNIGSQTYLIKIFLPKFIFDLDKAFDEFKKRLLTYGGNLQSNFVLRCQSIGFGKFE